MNIKKIILVALVALSLTTGCFKRDNLEGINIYTTTYPIEYLIQNIYGYNSNIDSIYPNGVNVEEYKLTDKQIKDYSKTDMFIYNGLVNEKQTAAQFLNNNKNLKIIDVTKGLTIVRDRQELWLCPSNYLMLAQNIKNSLNEYITATVVKQEIEKNYDDLKLQISKYDAELKKIAENAKNKTIIAGNDVFKFLEKYDFKVLSVEENDSYKPAELNEAKNSITNKNNSYVFLLDTDEESENVKKLTALGAKVVKINTIETLTDEEKANHYTYINMMNEFIENIKVEAYN